MHKLEQLTASRSTCQRLVELGIKPVAYLWHTVEDDMDNPEDSEGNPQLIHDVCLLRNPEYKPGVYGNVPAWTKAELDVLIGPEVISKPDLYRKADLGKHTDPYYYPIYYPTILKQYKNGAEASGQLLIWLIENKHITAPEVDEVNNRYEQMFQPVKTSNQ